MPHVKIKWFSGRTEEQKRKCAERIAEAFRNQHRLLEKKGKGLQHEYSIIMD